MLYPCRCETSGVIYGRLEAVCEGGAVCPPRAPPECFSWFYGLRP